MFVSQILNLISGWNSYKLRKTTASGHVIHKLVHEDLPATLAEWTPNPPCYKFQGSDGQGNILSAPWVAVFNRGITESATRGYYLVYLLSADLERIVLEIGFGATQFEKRFGRGRKFFDAVDSAVTNMRANSAHLLKNCLKTSYDRTNKEPVRLDSTGDFRLTAYEHCAIYSVTYQTARLPTEGALKADYLEYLALYDRMANSLLLAEVDDYVLETAEAPKATGLIKAADFLVRPQRKITRQAETHSGGSFRKSKKSDKVGRLGEEFIFEYEKRYLAEHGFPELASRVVWHRESQENRTPGWDITSYFEDGREKRIEVKSSEGEQINDILLTRNEWEKAQESMLEDNYLIYLVTNITSKPEIEVLRNPARYVEAGTLGISVENYSLSLRRI